MKYNINCKNKGSECNDREYPEASQVDLEQSIKSENIGEKFNELRNNFLEPQSIIYTEEKTSNQKYNSICIQKVIDVLGSECVILSNWCELSESEKFNLASNWMTRHFPNLPNTLVPILVGLFFPQDNAKHDDQEPRWLDREKFARGQRFACDYLFGISFAEVLGLFILFSFEDGLKPLIITGKSAEPYTAFTRYLSTANRVRNWYMSDPWTKGTAAYTDILIVRKKHQNVRDKLKKMTNKEIDNATQMNKTWSPSRDVLLEDFRSLCPVARPGQCPYAIDEMRDTRPCGLNQGDMAATQFGFFGLVILFPQAFGIHTATNDDLDAFCHVWRGIGFLLGIKDEYNFCRGTLDEIKQRSRDFLEMWVKPNLRNITPEWEHMSRCVTTGLQYYFPGAPYETTLLYLMELMGLGMPRFQSSLNYHAKLRHYMTKFVLKYPYRLSGVRNLLNRRLHQSMDCALNFDKEKHNKLREKSSKTMSTVLINKSNNNNEINVNVSSMSVAKYSQYKIIGVLMIITQCLILWRITAISVLS